MAVVRNVELHDKFQNLKWVFGFNKEGIVHSLSDEDREVRRLVAMLTKKGLFLHCCKYRCYL